VVFEQPQLTVEVADGRQFERQVRDVLQHLFDHLFIVVFDEPLKEQFKGNDQSMKPVALTAVAAVFRVHPHQLGVVLASQFAQGDLVENSGEEDIVVLLDTHTHRIDLAVD
jgi:hypothetical protein